MILRTAGMRNSVRSGIVDSQPPSLAWSAVLAIVHMR
jgi:hypothetical protein